MPWKIEHVCSPADPEPQPYGIYRSVVDGVPLTKIECPKCREQWFVMGHEMFAEAQGSESIGSRVNGLPPGFVIAKTRTRI